MSHYYSEITDAKSNEQRILVKFKDYSLPFITDNGVFCKDYLDFGSRVLLESAEIYGNDILDLGCGYGPVGIIIKKMHPSVNITCCDINERALELTKKNLVLNGITGNVIKSNACENIDSNFTSVLTNPPIRAGKEVVFAFYKGAYNHLVSGGVLYVVIQKKQGAPSSMKYLTDLFGNCTVVNKEKGYFILKSIK